MENQQSETNEYDNNITIEKGKNRSTNGMIATMLVVTVYDIRFNRQRQKAMCKYMMQLNTELIARNAPQIRFLQQFIMGVWNKLSGRLKGKQYLLAEKL